MTLIVLFIRIPFFPLRSGASRGLLLLSKVRGMTQKYLGQAVGFSEKTADVRMAQYDPAHGHRNPI